MGVSELLSLFRGNDSVWQVNLVGHQYFSNTLARMGVDLFQPIGDVVKSGFFSAVVDQDNAHGALVVGLGDGSEPLLAGSVPNLQLDPLIVDVDCLDFEIDSCKHHGQPTNRNEEICHQGRSRWGRGWGGSLPMVGMWLVGKWSSENRSKMQLLPTEESPMMISLIKWSYCFRETPPDVIFYKLEFTIITILKT